MLARKGLSKSAHSIRNSTCHRKSGWLPRFRASIKTHQTTLALCLIAVAALAEFGAVIDGKLPELRIGRVGIRAIGLDARDGLAKAFIRYIQTRKNRHFREDI